MAPAHRRQRLQQRVASRVEGGSRKAARSTGCRSRSEVDDGRRRRGAPTGPRPRRGSRRTARGSPPLPAHREDRRARIVAPSLGFCHAPSLPYPRSGCDAIGEQLPQPFECLGVVAAQVRLGEGSAEGVESRRRPYLVREGHVGAAALRGRELVGPARATAEVLATAPLLDDPRGRGSITSISPVAFGPAPLARKRALAPTPLGSPISSQSTRKWSVHGWWAARSSSRSWTSAGGRATVMETETVREALQWGGPPSVVTVCSTCRVAQCVHAPPRMSSRPATARRATTRTDGCEARERIVAAAERLLRELPVPRAVGRGGHGGGRPVAHGLLPPLRRAGRARAVAVRRDRQELVAELPAHRGRDSAGVLAAAVDAYARHGSIMRAVDEAARTTPRSRSPTAPSSTHSPR